MLYNLSMSNFSEQKTKVIQTFILDDLVTQNLVEILGLSCDDENYLVYKETGEKALSLNGREMKMEDFGGVIKGSTLLMRSDIDSILSLADRLED